MTRADRIAKLKQTAKERVLILDGSWGVMFQKMGLQEADYRGDLDLPLDQKGNNDILALTKPDVPEGIHRADILPATQDTAGRHKPRDREGARSGPDRDIGHRIFQPVGEQGHGQAAPAPLAAKTQLKPLQPLGTQPGIGLGNVIAHPERPVQLIEGRRPEADIAGRAAIPAPSQVAAQADARVDHADLTALLYFQGYQASEFVGG